MEGVGTKMKNELASSLPPMDGWLNRPAREIEAYVAGLPDPLVVGWPYNGTRRWFLSHERRAPGTRGGGRKGGCG